MVITDGQRSYTAPCGEDYRHTPFNVHASPPPANVPPSGVHRVAALVNGKPLGTHQGAVEADHLQAHLNNYCFHFNWRHPTVRLLFIYHLRCLAVSPPPLTYRNLVVNPQSKRRRSIPPAEAETTEPDPPTCDPALAPGCRTEVSHGPSDEYTPLNYELFIFNPLTTFS